VTGVQTCALPIFFFGKEIIYSSHKKLIQLNKRREGNQPERVIKEEGESALSRCEIS
jgi:hypothetical protein